MGVLEYRDNELKKHMIFSFESSNFRNIGYWLRTLKLKFKKSNIKKIKVTFNIEFIESEE